MHRRIKRKKPKLELIKVPNPHPGNTRLTEDELLARREEAHRLRYEEHKSLRDIGKELGVSRHTIQQDLLYLAKLRFKGYLERDETVLHDNNVIADEVIYTFLPFLKPLADKKILIGDTKFPRNGPAYDITIPEWEAAKGAADTIHKFLEHRAKLNGYVGPTDKQVTKEAGEIAGSVLSELVRNLTSRTVKAEIIENDPPVLENGE